MVITLKEIIKLEITLLAIANLPLGVVTTNKIANDNGNTNTNK